MSLTALFELRADPRVGREHRTEEPPERPVVEETEGDATDISTGQKRVSAGGQLRGDLGPRVGGPDDEDRAVGELLWVSVFAGMQVGNRRVESFGEVGNGRVGNGPVATTT